MKALALRGLSTLGNAELSLEEDDSTSPAVEHPPRIKFKRPEKTASYIKNVSTAFIVATITIYRSTLNIIMHLLCHCRS
jgi:hypothetical protein